MDVKQCKYCDHFLQHYGLGRNTLFQVNCGHCTFQRAKHKRPDAKAYENFTPAQLQEEMFVTKEFLSKPLLQKVLDMLLLPEMDG